MLNLSDSYKYSHFLQYQEDTAYISAYASARKAERPVVFFGLSYYLNEYFTAERITHCSKNILSAHGLPFNEKMASISKLPVNIWAVPEGTLVEKGRPFMVVENTDPSFPWLPCFMETLLLKLWYPINIATRSYYIRKDHGLNPFQFHNFGDRGSSSVESALIGGLAHLTSFLGTDNFNAVQDGWYYYADCFGSNRQVLGYSIPAVEHSTITSWGRDQEQDFILNFIDTFRDHKVIACVLDSYNIFEAVDFATNRNVEDKLKANGQKLVIRPDSGDPVAVLLRIFDIMLLKARQTLKDGKVVFDHYSVIWGDGIDDSAIHAILSLCDSKNISRDVVAFGSGGWLMQQHCRDTHGVAYKASAKSSDGKEWIGFGKDPITDPGKRSLQGRQSTEGMELVFSNGKILKDYTMDQVRTNLWGGSF